MKDSERNKRFKKKRSEILKRRTNIQKDTLKEVDRLLKAAQKQIDISLASAPSEFEAWYLPQLQRSVTQSMTDFSNESIKTLSQSANTSWQSGIELIDEPLKAGGINVSAVLPSIDNNQLIAMRSFMTERMKDVGVQLANKINTEIGLIAIGAQTPGDAVGKIAGLLEKGGRSRAITVVRDNLGRAFSMASHQRQTQASEFLPGLKKQWRRSSKIHSRFHHDAADGQIRDVDKTFQLYAKTGTVNLMYPRDPSAPIGETINCGCESLPFMESWDMKFPKRKPYESYELTNELRQSLAG